MKTTRDDKTWIQTYTGRAFDLLDPRPEQIDPLDIAHALSQICRFTGHVREFYSVAQHSVLVACIVPEPLALAALKAGWADRADAMLGWLVALPIPPLVYLAPSWSWIVAATVAPSRLTSRTSQRRTSLKSRAMMALDVKNVPSRS